MNACIVFVSGTERAVARSCFLYGACRTFHKFRVAFFVIKVNERERFIWQHERGAAVYHVVDQHFALPQPVTKRLDLVCGAQREVMIRQSDTGAFAFPELVEEVCDIETRADVEERLVKREIEFKHLPARPGVEVDVMGHGAAIVIHRLCRFY